MDKIFESLFTSAGLLWKAFWALAFGYSFSAIIQVFISKKSAVRHLGSEGPKDLGIAATLGFISSSCSFAALSATRSLFVKGASLPASLSYMFASTNLAIEVAALAYIFLGWQYALALFLGAPILIITQAILVRLTQPDALTKQAKKHAENISGHTMDPSGGLPKSMKEKIRNKKTWLRVASAYKSEWKMVYRELFIGFLVAGFVATLVPKSFYQVIFPNEASLWFILPLQAFMAPLLSIITIIGSMGNGPLAAILANNGVLFGAIMAFLYSDFIVPPALKINANYYGVKFAAYIGVITAISAIVTGIAIHLLFKLFGLVPTSAKNLSELATFRIDYTFWLNIAAFIIGITLFILSRQEKSAKS